MSADLGDRTFLRFEWVDIKDTVNKWCLGQVVEVAEGRVCVHYDGWPSKWGMHTLVCALRL